MRKLAREAVIFALLGMLLGIMGAFIVAYSEARSGAKSEAGRAVHAICVGCTVEIVEGVDPWDRLWLKVSLSDGTVLDVPVCVSDEETNCRHTWHGQDGKVWRNYRPIPGLVRVRGPDGKRYLFPPGTTKEAAISYFKAQGIGTSDAGRSAPERPESPPNVEPYPLLDEVSSKVDQLEVANDYWAAYRHAKLRSLMNNAPHFLLIGSLGFPAGLCVWAFYRLVHFAIRG